MRQAAEQLEVEVGDARPGQESGGRSSSAGEEHGGCPRQGNRHSEPLDSGNRTIVKVAHVSRPRIRINWMIPATTPRMRKIKRRKVVENR